MLLSSLEKSFIGTILRRRQLMSGSKRPMCSNDGELRENSSSSNVSEFDQHLEKEIEFAKSQIKTKLRNKKLRANVQSTQLRDDSGFKLRVNNSDGKKARQVEPNYEVIIDGPLRKIKPYKFTYKTFCKLRWRDRNLLEVFVNEFRDREPSYYKEAIEQGKVFLNDKPANLESIIKNGDYITHDIHRHEPPVTSRPIKIVFENADLLAIDKPGGIPVHPTGRFRFNTITKILEKQYGQVVHPCNRLDKLTSGLMFLAKSPKGADEMGDQLKAREVSKEYIAKVVGEFPVGTIVVEKPVKSVDPRVALNAVCTMEDENAKHAKTIFKRLSYDGQTSIVKCKPLTGRTHQIRVHLQYLGHPIANDPIYSTPDIWGPNLGKNGEANFEEVIEKLDRVGKTVAAESWFFRDAAGEVLTDKKCEVCQSALYTDPGPNDLDLWLHAYKYQSTVENERKEKSWSYNTEYPDWAKESLLGYMRLALDEAKKCEPTTTAFCVGAVLLNGTEILSTGYSRELPGNTHAEQCALEKYYAKNGKRTVPKGTVLFTTMEPCSFRQSGNETCLSRILKLNGAISTVFVGIIEPKTFVENNVSYSALQDNDIDYIKIPGFEEECLKIAKKGHEQLTHN